VTDRVNKGQFWAVRRFKEIQLLQTRPKWVVFAKNGRWEEDSRYICSYMPVAHYRHIFGKTAVPRNRQTALLIDAAEGRIVEVMKSGRADVPKEKP